MSIYKIAPFFLLIAISFAANISLATTHYVAPHGNATWAQAMAINTPCSLATVNEYVAAGDTVYFRGGSYDIALDPESGSGTPSNPMAFLSFPGETPVIDVQGNDYFCVDLDDVSYVTLEGLTIQNPSTDYAISACGYLNPPAYEIVIRDCTIIHGGIYSDMTDGIQVLNCTITDNPGAGIVFYGTEFHKLTNSRIEGCTISNSGNDGITLHADDEHHNLGSHHLLRNNIVDTVAAENCYDITSGDHIVLDGNECIGCPEPGVNIGGNTAANQVKWVRVVNQVSHDLGLGGEQFYVGGSGVENIIFSRSVGYGLGENSLQTSAEQAGHSLTHVRIFNNTFDAREIDDRTSIQINETVGDLSLKNNIIYLDDNGVGIYWEPNPDDPDMYANSDLYWHTTQSPGYEDIWNQEQDLAHICGIFKRECDGLEMDPLFNPFSSGDDFSLQNHSPAIDSGSWLSIIISDSGFGTTFVVEDALWFYDGWNIHGETGDVVRTESGRRATITAIDYYTNSITVDQTINWTQGEGIALDYQGTKPDIGAFEHEGASSPVTDQMLPVAGLNISNYPNPFNPRTTISYLLAQSGKVEMRIYDLAGREIATLVDGYKAQGSHNVVFNTADHSSGVYLCVVTAGGFKETVKMVLLK